MRMVGEELGSPLLDVSVTPGAAPASAPVTLVTCDCAIFWSSTTVAEPVKADFLAVPKATTITSSSNSALVFIYTVIFG